MSPVTGTAVSSSGATAQKALNLYATLETFQGHLGGSSYTSIEDALQIAILEAVSRQIDDYCKRYFYSETATRYFDPSVGSELILDPWDLLSVTSLKTDEDEDFDYDYTWTATDYLLYPYDRFPIWKILIHPDGDYTFPVLKKSTQIIGVWGYGDGASSSPWQTTAITGTLADASDTSLVISATGTIETGHTIMIGTEQLYVEALNSTTLTVTRKVNGTTAAAHSAALISTAKYPARVHQACLYLASMTWNERGSEAMQQERIGDYSYLRPQSPGWESGILVRLLGSYVRGAL